MALIELAAFKVKVLKVSDGDKKVQVINSSSLVTHSVFVMLPATESFSLSDINSFFPLMLTEGQLK